MLDGGTGSPGFYVGGPGVVGHVRPGARGAFGCSRPGGRRLDVAGRVEGAFAPWPAVPPAAKAPRRWRFVGTILLIASGMVGKVDLTTLFQSGGSAVTPLLGRTPESEQQICHLGVAAITAAVDDVSARGVLREA